MARVVVIRPFRYSNRALKAKDEVEMPDFHAELFKKAGKVKDYEPPEEPPSVRRRYRRRDMVVEGSEE